MFVVARVGFMCVFYLGFSAGNASCGRVQIVGRVSFGEGDGLFATKRVCHRDQAPREAAHRSLELDRFLQVAKLACVFRG